MGLEIVWMVLTLIGFAEIAIVVRLKNLIAELTYEARAIRFAHTGIAKQVKRLGAMINVLEQRLAMFERAADAREKGEGNGSHSELVEPDTP